MAEREARRHGGESGDLGLDGEAADRLGCQADRHDADGRRHGRAPQLAGEGTDAERRGRVGEGDGGGEAGPFRLQQAGDGAGNPQADPQAGHRDEEGRGPAASPVASRPTARTTRLPARPTPSRILA